jgi:2-polyprenyl-3-methyl-5-hydroxy-6-metoxy-1,4-benzoquinol methylase
MPAGYGDCRTYSRIGNTVNNKEDIKCKFGNDDLVTALELLNKLHPSELDPELIDLKNKIEAMTAHLLNRNDYKALYDKAAARTHKLKWETIKDKRQSIKKIVKNACTKYYRKKAKEDYRYVTFEHYFSSIKSNIRSVLDIGCHDAAFIKLLGELNPDVSFFGLEISERIVHFAEQNAPVQNVFIKEGFAEDAPLLFDRTFDLIVLWEILEHVPNHLDLIEIAERMLMPHGHICITVPIKSHQSICITNRPVEHVRGFTPDTVKKDFGDKSNFNMVRIIDPKKSGPGHETGSYFITYTNTKKNL